ncbi:hypothetical protein ACIPJQ_38755 [Streptomyces griseoviridis]
MNITSRPTAGLATENFDAETLALLEAVEVPLPGFAADVDLDVIFGTPLEMYEPFATRREQTLPMETLIEEFFARRHAALDIAADDPSITRFVRERLVDVLLPHAVQLRVTPPAAAAPLSIAA